VKNGSRSQAPKPSRAHDSSLLRSARISRFLASYSAHLFLVISTIVHTAFQRIFAWTSRCHVTHLAQSPQPSTCAIHMNDNNLGKHSLLRLESTASTLRSPRRNRYATDAPRDPRRRTPPCISFPAIRHQARSSRLRARRCAQPVREPLIPRRSAGRDSGALRMNAITRAACGGGPTELCSGTASTTRARRRSCAFVVRCPSPFVVRRTSACVVRRTSGRVIAQRTG
jgi:hypothetical protein